MSPLCRRSGWSAVLLAFLAASRPAAAHCDTTRGPVVKDARAALEAGDPKLVLHWVRPQDEAAVRGAFENTLAVRTLGPAANELADRYFFETLVRIHRAGEGAPYTGLTDDEPEPHILATDRALERGSAAELEGELIAAVRSGLAERFAAARRAAMDFRPGDVAAGRAYVAAYVPLTHWVEGVLGAAQAPGGHHAARDAHPAAAPAVHQPTEHGQNGASAETHERSAVTALPWILAVLLGAAAAVEAALLLRRRRPASA